MVASGARPMISLRKPTEDDIERFCHCLAADQDHGIQDPNRWTDGEFFVFFDEKGNRVWVKLERVVRIHMQHDQESPASAVSRIIRRGFAWMQRDARTAGYNEIILESRAPRLVQFLEKLFGIERLKRQYSVRT